MTPYSDTKKVVQKARLNVLLVEDSPTDALLVQAVIEELPDFQLEKVSRLSEAIECLKTKDFDIILLDLNLPDAAGLEAVVKLRQYVQEIAIIVFTGMDDEQLGIMALQGGAQDYLVKAIDNSRLVRSMRYAIERMQVHGPGSSTKNIDHIDSIKSRQVNKYEVLTERELQVLKLLGKGCTNDEIAEQLSIGLTTVKTHISNVLHKLSVTDRTKAIVKAMQLGLI